MTDLDDSSHGVALGHGGVVSENGDRSADAVVGPPAPTPGMTVDGAGYSLANAGEVMFACLEAAQARSIVEVGAYLGELTASLLAWGSRAGVRVTAIEPAPGSAIRELAEREPELELIAETSHEALRHAGRADAVIIDGDHNYYTLSGELRLIAEGAPGAAMPLVLLHDVGWPHARRDTYYEPERIPESDRQPLARGAYLVPDQPGVAAAGLHYEWAAAREGGPRNGCLTAVEDFIAEHERMRLAIVPAFFGFGVLWHEDAPWAEAMATTIAPWDRNPILARLEAHRVAHLVARIAAAQELDQAKVAGAESLAATTYQKELLWRLLHSSAFTWTERISRLRGRGRPVVSRAEIQRALDLG